MTVTIVGQGVAGTLLAFELEKRGVDFLIIDQGQNHSSAIAAGIMNPVVFRRLTKSWKVDECWNLAIETYTTLEQKLGTTFFYSKPMRRLFASDQELGFWLEKTKNEDFKTYIDLFGEQDETPSYANNTHGNGLVKSVHHIDVRSFLLAARAYFIQNDKIKTQEADYAELLENLQTKQSDALIFCQGYQNFENPFFNKLPVQTTKGQIITIKNGEMSQHELLNRKCFMLPIGNDLFRVGATYEWENTSLITTDEARVQLSEKLESLINVPFKIVEQQAGIRPTTPDRRPILGEHPEYQNMFILNGLGTKGYLLAPWCVDHLLSHMLFGSEILNEVDLKRFGVY